MDKSKIVHRLAIIFNQSVIVAATIAIPLWLVTYFGGYNSCLSAGDVGFRLITSIFLVDQAYQHLKLLQEQ